MEHTNDHSAEVPPQSIDRIVALELDHIASRRRMILLDERLVALDARVDNLMQLLGHTATAMRLAIEGIKAALDHNHEQCVSNGDWLWRHDKELAVLTAHLGNLTKRVDVETVPAGLITYTCHCHVPEAAPDAHLEDSYDSANGDD